VVVVEKKDSVEEQKEEEVQKSLDGLSRPALTPVAISYAVHTANMCRGCLDISRHGQISCPIQEERDARRSSPSSNEQKFCIKIVYLKPSVAPEVKSERTGSEAKSGCAGRVIKLACRSKPQVFWIGL
jgi:hypothetical protein